MLPMSHADILVCFFLTNLAFFFSCTSSIICPLLLVVLLQMVAFILLYKRTSYTGLLRLVLDTRIWLYDIKCKSFSKLDISWISCSFWVKYRIRLRNRTAVGQEPGPAFDVMSYHHIGN